MTPTVKSQLRAVLAQDEAGQRSEIVFARMVVERVDRMGEQIEGYYDVDTIRAMRIFLRLSRSKFPDLWQST